MSLDKLSPEGIRYHNKRRATQVIALLLIVLIPLSGLFRIDLQAGYFVILERQIWWSDYNLILGFWIMLATVAVMTYSTIGTVWCGWACPQNSISELINRLTFKLLGKRASVSISSEKSKIAAAKNNPLNWFILIFCVLGVSSVLAIIPFLYFYPPDAVWSLLTFRMDARLPRFTYYLYLVVVFAVFLDIALIRNVLCNYFCLYRMWQHIFKTKKTLHVEYDTSRSSECSKCNYCEATCFLDFNPVQFKIHDSCINCGDCIDACNNLHEKKGKVGLLQFHFGEQRQTNTWRDSVDELFSRLSWAGALFAVGCTLFIWGFAHYSPYSIVAYSADKNHVQGHNNYKILVSNKVYSTAEIVLSVTGIPSDSFKLGAGNLEISPSSRTSVDLDISPNLPKGLHQIIIEARGNNGWVGHFNIQHFSAAN